MIKINLKGGKKFLAKMAARVAAIEAAEEIATRKAGDKLVKEMQRTIDDETEPWPSLSPNTIWRKGHDKMLIETRLMRDSIEWRQDGNTITVGVHADAPEDRALVALIQEHGAPDAGIPARPFIQPTWEREKKGIIRLFDEEIKRGL
jgi:hypothetical protein